MYVCMYVCLCMYMYVCIIVYMYVMYNMCISISENYIVNYTISNHTKF